MGDWRNFAPALNIRAIVTFNGASFSCVIDWDRGQSVPISCVEAETIVTSRRRTEHGENCTTGARNLNTQGKSRICISVCNGLFLSIAFISPNLSVCFLFNLSFSLCHIDNITVFPSTIILNEWSENMWLTFWYHPIPSSISASTAWPPGNLMTDQQPRDLLTAAAVILSPALARPRVSAVRGRALASLTAGPRHCPEVRAHPRYPHPLVTTPGPPPWAPQPR